MKALYIEDNLIDRRYFGRIMKKLQVDSCIMADSVKTALPYLENYVFDIIFFVEIIIDNL